ncbi:MAG: alpha-glucosidase C-terminal domain-containing protein, partial [Bacteroidales bacterium]|nr:alpha-glucosidase C-terminal domain-containing protein [Bacteroidales bacterium]
VIWYQIFVERFRNGDPSNDPAPADIKGAYPDEIPENWEVTPWGHDWYKQEPWLDSVNAGDFNSKIQARRYGGDLQGVLDKMDYLQELGISAIYFNPLNDSPSLHKYDARNYTHIDRNFGPDPAGDAQVMNSEIPGDPATWKWTKADKLFLRLVSECHSRGIRVIMDYSWNHTGRIFWALDDIRKNGGDSEFTEWYNIHEFDNPATPEDEFRYEGWGGNNPWMPVFRKDIIPPDDSIMPFEGNLHSGSLKQHIFSVSKRWLDPDNNGDPADGVDGFRLDVAGEIPMGFWRDYRKVVRSVNPQAYLVGEIWWLEWPDKLLDPGIFLRGDQYDAIMNYRWYRVARGFFGQAVPVLTPTGFISEIDRINKGIRTDNLQVMMNVAATHDSPRLSTSLYNKTMDKYNAKPSDDPDYKINKPDELTRKEQMLLLVHQYTFIGAPHIWNGDEVGMWGADDPDCRKPVVWDDIVYEDEKAHYYPAKIRPVDKVEPDTALLSFYKKLISLRRENPALVHGDLKFILADDKKMLIGYKRIYDDDEIISVFNRSLQAQSAAITIKHGDTFRDLVSMGGSWKASGSGLEINLEPLGAVVLRKY